MLRGLAPRAAVPAAVRAGIGALVVARAGSGLAVLADAGQLAKQLLLFVGEVRRKLADEAHVLVAVAAVFQLRHPLAGQPQHLVVLRARRDRHRDVAVHRRYAHLGAQHQVVDADGQVEVQIVALALVAVVVCQVHHQVQIAARSAAGPARALPGEADALAVAHPARDRHVELLRLAHASRAVALRADAVAVRPRPAAARARVLDLERHRLAPALERVVQRELDRRFQVLAALVLRGEPGTGRPLAADPGEEHVEEVREPARAAAGRGAEAAEVAEVGALRLAVRAVLVGFARGLLPVRAQDVVLLALLGIAENLVRLLDVLELLFGLARVVGVRVRMPLARQLAVRALDVFLGRGLRHAQDRVIVFVVHAVLATTTCAGRSTSSPIVYALWASSRTVSSATPSGAGLVAIASASFGSNGCPLSETLFTPSPASAVSNMRSVACKPPRSPSESSNATARSRLSSTGSIFVSTDFLPASAMSPIWRSMRFL